MILKASQSTNLLFPLFLFLGVIFFSGLFLSVSVYAETKETVTKLPEKQHLDKMSDKKIVKKLKSKTSYLSGLNKKLSYEEETEPLVTSSLGNMPDDGVEKSIPNEENQPLNLKSQKEKGEAGVSSFERMAMAMGTLVFFVLLGFYFIHKSGHRGALLSGAKNIQILSQKSLGGKRQLMVIKIAGESILLGVTEQNINFIKNLALLEDELPEFSPENFKNELNKNLVEDVKTQKKEFGFSVSRLDEVKDIVSKRYRG